jgi:hypothetical protein
VNEGVDDANWISRNLVLSSAAGALGLGRVQLQSVRLHPIRYIVGLPGEAVSNDQNIRKSTGAVNLSVISISMTRTQMTLNESKSASQRKKRWDQGLNLEEPQREPEVEQNVGQRHERTVCDRRDGTETKERSTIKRCTINCNKILNTD